jgi:hypothetical protein
MRWPPCGAAVPFRTVVATAAAAAVVIASAVTFALTRDPVHDPNAVSTDPPVSTSDPAAQMRLLADERAPTPLDRARLDLPDFHHSYSPQGQTEFYDRQWTGPSVTDALDARAFITDVVEGDVTGDGQAELIALVTCNAGTDAGSRATQVVAYTKAGAVLGQVTWASGEQAELRPRADGKVGVLYVSRPNAGPATAVEWRSWRRRGPVVAVRVRLIGTTVPGSWSGGRLSRL